MDYKEKYEQSLARAKEQLDGAKVFDYDNEQIVHDIRTTVYNIFPELKGSEDEKIRKTLRKRIIRYDPNNEILIKEEGISQKQFLAWLEKQGEQKYSWSEEDEKKRTLLIRILEVNHPNGYFKVNPANTSNIEAIHTEELVSWLKSLRPQNRWTEAIAYADGLVEKLKGE